MPISRHRHWLAGALLLVLLTSEFVVYLPSMKGYFFGDSIGQIISRPRTLRAAVGTFGEVRAWYRPLTQPVANYLLFPLFGFHFRPFHLVALSLHMLTSALVFFALLDLTGHEWAAFAGAWFFGVHSINFYTTYDGAFFAETVLVAAYVGALWSFLRQRYGLALCCLAIGLVSKETAVTIVPLFVILFFATGDYKRRDLRTSQIKFAVAVFVLLAGYCAVYAPHFEIQGWSLISNQRADYPLSIQQIPENFGNYVSWIFHMPQTWLTRDWVSAKWNMRLHGAFAVVVGIFALMRVARKDMRVCLGLLLFTLPALPTLLTRPFVHHAYLPLVGVSVIIACLFMAAKARLPSALFVIVFLVFLSYQASISYRNVRADNLDSWVGVAANHARQAAATIDSVKSRLQGKTGLVIVNQTPDPLDFIIGGTSLPPLVTGIEGLKVQILEGNQAVPAALADFVILKYDGNVLYLP